MANSTMAKVVNKVPESKAKTLADLLATALTLSSDNDAKNAMYTELTSNCKDATPRGIVGVSTQKCGLVVIANYYNVQADGSLVKDSESSYDFSFNVVKPVVPNPVLKIDGPVTVTVAD